MEDNKEKGKDFGNNEKLEWNWEFILCKIANVLLLCGIVASVVLFFVLCFKSPEYKYDRPEFVPGGIIPTIATFASSIVSWAMIHGFAQIIKTLDEINKTLKVIEKKNMKQIGE